MIQVMTLLTRMSQKLYSNHDTIDSITKMFDQNHDIIDSNHIKA